MVEVKRIINWYFKFASNFSSHHQVSRSHWIGVNWPHFPEFSLSRIYVVFTLSFSACLYSCSDSSAGGWLGLGLYGPSLST